MLGYAEVEDVEVEDVEVEDVEMEDVEMEDISAGDTMLPVPAPQGFLSGHSVRKLDSRYRHIGDESQAGCHGVPWLEVKSRLCACAGVRL
jgi:hypothetical protein